MKRSRLLMIVALIVAAAAARLLPHPPNVTPIAAMALFGGALLRPRALAFAVPLLAMALSDLLLGLTVYGTAALSSRPVVYGCFAATVGLGEWARRRSAGRILTAALSASVLFFLATNLAVWAGGHLYPRTSGGLLACYVAALPYFRNTLVGNSLYAALLFGGMALAERWSPSLRETRRST